MFRFASNPRKIHFIVKEIQKTLDFIKYLKEPNNLEFELLFHPKKGFSKI